MARIGHAGKWSGSENGAAGRTVLQVARRLAATIGTEFFRAMAKHLAEALAADCVLLGEFAPGHVERVKTLATYVDSQDENLDFELAGSAAAQIALGRSYLCSSGVQDRFPADELLAKLDAQACAGLPLVDSHGQPIGVIMAIYRRPVANLRSAKAMLEVFQPRASAELQRIVEDEKLRESEQRYRAFIAQSADALYRLEFEQPIPADLPIEEQVKLIERLGYLAECNEAFLRLHGADRMEKLIGCRISEIIPEWKADLKEASRWASAGYKLTMVETTPVEHGGKRRYLLRSLWGIVDDGKLRRVWGISRDITEFKYTELALSASEQRMADLLEAVHLLVIMADLEGKIAFCNNYFFRLTGWQPPDVLGRDWLELMISPAEQGKFRAAFARAHLDPGSPSHLESALLGPKGERWEIAWDSALLRDSEGKPAAWVNAGRDVTQYKALEAELRQNQKLASLGRLAGGVAHDFNNLLTVMLGYSAALAERGDIPDAVRQGLTEIRKAAERGSEMTNRLLAFGRRRAQRAELLNLNTVVADAELMLRRLIGASTKLTTSLDPSLGLVRADSGHLQQVLVNLVVNARDAMPEGGAITITTSNFDAPARSPATPGLAPGEYVLLTVSDCGSGMNEEVKRHCFEPFFTTKEQGKGTGLGLSTVYGIVQQSGGQIVVESEPGKGTCFRIFLPRIQAESTTARETPCAPTAACGTETILLVEDQKEVRVFTASALRGLGYTVIEAENSAEALELAGHADVIDILLTDILMPGMAGGELAELIKASDPQIKVLFMSGYTAGQSIEQLTQRGFRYIQKPFTPTELANKVRETLDSHP
jgi:PAS domain S-box-containing protein